MVEKVTVPADMAAQLTRANGFPVPICNEAGQIIAFCVSPALLAKYIPPPATGGWTDEEIARIAERSNNDTHPKRTMAEVLRMVEGGSPRE